MNGYQPATGPAEPDQPPPGRASASRDDWPEVMADAFAAALAADGTALAEAIIRLDEHQRARLREAAHRLAAATRPGTWRVGGH